MAAKLRPLAMGDQIAHRLRVDIITGAVADGTHLAEDGLADRFDVSRGPVRDALRQLESEGLVENRRKRLYARSLGMRDIEELYELRESLESLALRLAMRNAEPEDWDGIQLVVDDMAAAGERDDFERFANADMDFHTGFYRLSQNRRLMEAWRPYQRTFAILFELSYTPDIPAAVEDHQEFLDVIRSGETGAAVERLHGHLAHAKAHLREILSKAG
ncbi:GntR family transcriptional regulator [Glycomyces sp. NPDC047010]|uniref:GntR family transcriptional regulator n=1 Tax=Glycomyces sp. NPDC047010 TaxID=3155023 RepID=UPI00340F08C0